MKEKEKEIKVLKVDFEDVERKLINAGAKLIKDERQTNWIFSVDALKIQGGEKGYLRLRSTYSLITQETNHEFTLKMKESDQEIRVYEELTTMIADPQALLGIMQLIDHPVQYRGEKSRKSYEWKGINFEMDQWDANTYPTPYLEIEVQSEADLDRALDLLGLTRSDTTTKSISDLREEWRQEHVN